MLRSTPAPKPLPGAPAPKVGKEEVKKEEKKEVIRITRAPRSHIELSKRMNPYYMTLSQPSQYVGYRIPTADFDASCAFTIVYRSNFTTNANGCGGAMYGYGGNASDSLANLIPLPTSINFNLLAYTYVFGMTNNSAAPYTNAPFTWTGSSANDPIPEILPGWNASNATIPATFQAVRLVSAGLAVECTASRYTAAGSLIGASVPKAFLKDASLTSITTTLVKSYPGAVVCPVNEFKGISMTYNPSDPSCYDYVPVGTSGGDPSYKAQVGTFIVVVEGAPASCSFNTTIVLNYEGIPQTDKLSFISVQPTLDDPIALAEADNARQEDPLVVANTKGFGGLHESAHSHALSSVMEASPVNTPKCSMALHKTPMYCPCLNQGTSTPKTKEEKTMFESIADMILPLIEKAAPALLAAL